MKQPESIYRLQEADYDKMKSLRLVRAAASNRVVDAAAVNDLEEDDLAKRQHPPQGKVSRPTGSDPDSSFKSSRRTAVVVAAATTTTTSSIQYSSSS
jgi:hypothetical protein